MTILERFDNAFKSGKKYLSLKEEVVKLQNEGVGDEDLLAMLEVLRERVNSEDDEDIVLDVMDYLVGW